jgi:regulator of nucleoside diphosphate kinase
MATAKSGAVRPRIHLLASESDLVADLALQVEHRQPVVASMLLEEIERAELHDAATLPSDAVRLGSEIDFVDDKTHQLRRVQLVLPGHANVSEGRISILTPMGAALFGLRSGDSIDWPDLDDRSRRIRIVRVVQSEQEGERSAVN